MEREQFIYHIHLIVIPHLFDVCVDQWLQIIAGSINNELPLALESSGWKKNNFNKREKSIVFYYSRNSYSFADLFSDTVSGI